MPCKVTNIIICTHEPVPCVIGSTLNPTPYVILAAPLFAAAGLASVIDPDAAAWVNGAAADILDTEKTAENWVVNAVQFWKR
jgi:hypothetical protein